MRHLTLQLLGPLRHEGVWECGGTTPLILDVRIMLGCVVHGLQRCKGNVSFSCAIYRIP
jgi:hypothetical protein